jgi:cation diffusion facilitator family transporter
MASASAASMDVTRTGVRRVLLITLLLNVVVSGAKIFVGKLTGSLSMVADGYHSLMDGTNNVVGLVVTTFAYAPPDEGHPYGHRKFETAATLVIGMALLGLAYTVFEQSLGVAARTRLPMIGVLNWVVMGVTLVVNLFVAAYEARQGRKLGSAYLTADATHTRSDIYVTLGVMASFAGAKAGVPLVDSVVAIGIAGFISILAVRIMVGSFHTLTDRAVIPGETLAHVVMSVPGVQNCREVRTRGGPGAVYVDMIVHVDGQISLRAAHDIADRIEEAVQAKHPEVVDVIVHLEPAERRR